MNKPWFAIGGTILLGILCIAYLIWLPPGILTTQISPTPTPDVYIDKYNDIDMSQGLDVDVWGFDLITIREGDKILFEWERGK